MIKIPPRIYYRKRCIACGATNQLFVTSFCAKGKIHLDMTGWMPHAWDIDEYTNVRIRCDNCGRTFKPKDLEYIPNDQTCVQCGRSPVEWSADGYFYCPHCGYDELAEVTTGVGRQVRL